MPDTGAPTMRRLSAAYHVAFSMLLLAAFALRLSRLSYLVLAIGAVNALAQMPRLRCAAAAERRLLALMVIGPASLLVISIPRVGLSVLFHLLVVLAASGAAFGATRTPRNFWRSCRWTLVATQGVVLAYLATTGLTGFPLEELIPDSSSNGITSYLLVLQISYSLAHYALHRRVTWATQLVTLFICIVGYGRGSIVASLALLLGSLAVSSVSRSARSRLPALAAVAVLAIGVVRYHDEIALFVDANTKFGVAVGDFHRELIIRGYLGELTPVGALVGGPYDGTVIARNYNGNPHNSFIRAHHVFGLFYLLSVLALPFVAIRRGSSIAGTAYTLLGLGVLYFRAFTEPILFPTLLDYFVFGTCFALQATTGLTTNVSRAAVSPTAAPPSTSPRLAAA